MAGSLTGRASISQRMARGLGITIPATMLGSAFTNASLASGGFGCTPIFNNIGTTQYTTIAGIQLPAGLPGPLRPTMMNVASSAGNNSASFILGYFYKLGTLAFSGTAPFAGFTHDTATFPVTRTQFGVASQPVTLIPVLLVDVATTTTIAVIALNNAGSTAGYVNQGGATVVGVKTITMPLAATVKGSSFIFRLEIEDSGVQDIQAIQVTTAASAGTGQIFGFEPLITSVAVNGAWSTSRNCLFGGLCLPDLTPAIATSGTATSFLGILGFTNGSFAGQATVVIDTVLDTT